MRDYSKFYTPEPLARLLIDRCGDINPTSIIDICAGSWNLLNESKKKWPKSTLLGVDIDSKSRSSIIQDGRIFSSIALSHNKKFELVVANPPFQYEKLSEEMSLLIMKHISNYKFNGNILKRLENTMMLFNSLLVSEKGTLAAIVPDGFVTSDTMLDLRRYFAENFFVEKIIKLPETAFGTDLNTHIIIFRNFFSRKWTEFYQAYLVNDDYELKLLGKLPRSRVKEGHWIIGTETKLIVQNPRFGIYRNNISTSLLTNTKKGYPVIHSDSIISGNIIRSQLSYTSDLPVNANLTKPGDIVIIRVGRKNGHFAIVTESEQNFLSSDCVLIIRPRENNVKELTEKLLSKKNLLKPKGLGMQYITKNDLITVLS